MASSFANVASAAAMETSAQPGMQVKDGDELIEIQTGQLGFKTINAETKLRLLPSPWPADNAPIPTAQLLSVASSQGMLAAAGPDVLIIASTDQIREALSAKEGDSIREISPILAIPHDRLTHVAFSSDESVLLVSGPSTRGLVAYQVEKLKAGESDVALRIHANTSLRALVPNPNPKSAHLFATVSADGELSIADLSTGNYIKGTDGITLNKDVTCVSWSNRGKQLIAGLTAGTAVQLKLDGTVAAQIPKSTSIQGETHVSTISWLENDLFFIIYTPDSLSAEDGIPPSEYFIVERREVNNYTFHRMPEVLPPFGVERLPTNHFVSRLRKFDPHLTDLLLLSATTATDVGIISNSSKPLSTSDNSTNLVTNTYTVTALEDDTMRAALPVSESSLDTSPIGMAIDLSSKEPVINPLPSDPEIQETSGPLPNLLVLNDEGLLCSWWVIYTDSIKQRTTFSGFESLKATEKIRSAVSAPASSESTPQPISDHAHSPNETGASPEAFQPSAATTLASSTSLFGSALGQSSFGAPKTQTSSLSGFGTGSSFGTTSKIGDEKSSWTNTGFGSTSNTSTTGSTFGQSSFGQPAFGTQSAIGGSNPTFGSSSSLGTRSTGFGQSASPAFGKTGFGSPAVSNSFTTGSGSGFASFAGSGGFTSNQEKKDQNNSSPFAKPTSGSGFSVFGSTPKSESPFAKASGSTPFGQGASNGTFGTGQGFGGFGNTTAANQRSSFGTGATFKIDSSFKGDGTAKDDLPPPAGGTSFGLGSNLGNMLGESKREASPAQDTEEEMNDDDDDQVSVSTDEKERPFSGFSPDEKKPGVEQPKTFITPPSTITQSKVTPAAPVSSLFGPPQQQTTTTTPQQPVTGFSFASTTPKETPAASRTLFGTNPISTTTPAAVQKSEPVKAFDTVSETRTTDVKQKFSSESTGEVKKATGNSLLAEALGGSKSAPAAPLPPNAISKPGYTTGDTSGSSANSKQSKEVDDAPLPPDFLKTNEPSTESIENAQIPEDAPLPPDFVPANRSAALQAEDSQLPEDEEDDDDEFSSDFEGSGEDITEDVSPVEGEDEDATTEQLQTSPESSFRGGDTTSPTGGLFTKVSANDASKSARPLFGEVERLVPLFPPPKPQQSPRSPSPVRRVAPHDSLRHDSRSVSAPLQSQSAINQRKSEYLQSAIAAQAARAREEEAAREMARLEAIKIKSQQAEANELQTLEDDEDERIQRELAAPVQPSEVLDEFITYQARTFAETSKADIPSQIERLYQDINSMICTLGINARSLSAFMMQQQVGNKDQNWPNELRAEAPLDTMKAKWSLGDIRRLHAGTTLLASEVAHLEVQGAPRKLESCQNLITRELFDLRSKIIAIRKSIYAKLHGSTSVAPLSAEQASIQHDLRKASASVQTSLVQLEDVLAMVKARLAEIGPSEDTGKGYSTSGNYGTQKKPTVEAVTNTIAKMTSMAEKKSADIDVLEAQLKKLDASLGSSVNGMASIEDIATPRRSRPSRITGTPSSAASSVFYTPDSKANASAKSTRSNGGGILSATVVSAEDRDRWQARLKRKRDVAAILRKVLEDKQKTAQTTA